MTPPPPPPKKNNDDRHGNANVVSFLSLGVLYNTEPLDYSKKHNFILEVRVEDCGGPQHSRTSDKVMINVKVKEACKMGWKGEYTETTTSSLYVRVPTAQANRENGHNNPCQGKHRHLGKFSKTQEFCMLKL